jgi:hypothetical protein
LSFELATNAGVDMLAIANNLIYEPDGIKASRPDHSPIQFAEKNSAGEKR